MEVHSTDDLVCRRYFVKWETRKFEWEILKKVILTFGKNGKTEKIAKKNFFFHSQ